MAHWVKLPDGDLLNTDYVMKVERNELSTYVRELTETSHYSPVNTEIRYEVTFSNGSREYLSERNGRALCAYLEMCAYHLLESDA